MGDVFADHSVLFAENERMLQRAVDDFAWVCKRKKSKVNVSKSTFIVLQRTSEQVTDFVQPYS